MSQIGTKRHYIKTLIFSVVLQWLDISAKKTALFPFLFVVLLASGVAALRAQAVPDSFVPKPNNYIQQHSGTTKGTAVRRTGQSSRTTNALYGALGSATELWVGHYNGPGNGPDDADGLAVSPDGSRVFVTGTSATGTTEDWATVAYDATTGNQLWVKLLNGPGNANDAPQAAPVVSPDGSRIYVTGNMTLGNGHFVMRTVAYNAADGSELWAASYQGPANIDDSARALALSSDDSRLFVTGWSDNWQDDPTQAAIISAAGLAPTNPLESGIAETLPPGQYTALLAGLNNGTGIGVVEVYDRGAP
jgi:hypothetical protein